MTTGTDLLAPAEPFCEECGEPCYEDDSPGVYLHGTGPGDPEDLDRDLDHVARPEAP